jgi:hypothetical protein
MYLSFFDKKDLTNGIDWFIPCVMNANETSPKANVRMNRIKIVSRIFRTLIGICAVFFTLVAIFAVIESIAVSSGSKVVPGESMTVHITFSPHQAYSVPFDMPLPVQFLGSMHLCLLGFGAIILIRLFKLYERGSFFAIGNVRCIKILGLIVVGDGLIQTALEFLPPNKSVEISNNLALGLLILLIAWIMDEGRKIQEEQELTV